MDGEATRATHDFLVTAAGNANAYASAVLDARMRDVDVSRPLVGFFAGVDPGLLALEIRDDFGAAVGAPSASFARVSMIPDGANPSLELTSHGRIALTFNATVAGEYAIFIEAGGAGRVRTRGEMAEIGDVARAWFASRWRRRARRARRRRRARPRNTKHGSCGFTRGVAF